MQEAVKVIKFDSNIFQASSPKNDTTTRIMFQGRESPLFKREKCQRKNEAKMSDDEKSMYINGIAQFNSFLSSHFVGGTYGQAVTIASQ